MLRAARRTKGAHLCYGDFTTVETPIVSNGRGRRLLAVAAQSCSRFGIFLGWEALKNLFGYFHGLFLGIAYTHREDFSRPESLDDVHVAVVACATVWQDVGVEVTAR